MNDKITISTAQLFTMFPDQETARTYLEDSTLADGCTRGARAIAAQPLAGRQEPGHGHEHIYQFGRAPHGNRSKAAKERRG